MQENNPSAAASGHSMSFFAFYCQHMQTLFEAMGFVVPMNRRDVSVLWVRDCSGAPVYKQRIYDGFCKTPSEKREAVAPRGSKDPAAEIALDDLLHLPDLWTDSSHSISRAKSRYLEGDDMIGALVAFLRSPSVRTVLPPEVLRLHLVSDDRDLWSASFLYPNVRVYDLQGEAVTWSRKEMVSRIFRSNGKKGIRSAIHPIPLSRVRDLLPLHLRVDGQTTAQACRSLEHWMIDTLAEQGNFDESRPPGHWKREDHKYWKRVGEAFIRNRYVSDPFDLLPEVYSDALMHMVPNLPEPCRSVCRKICSLFPTHSLEFYLQQLVDDRERDRAEAQAPHNGQQISRFYQVIDDRAANFVERVHKQVENIMWLVHPIRFSLTLEDAI